MQKLYLAKQGECISSIAFEHGFFPNTLWNHSENAELKKLRKDPNALLPGDKVAIPEMTIRTENRSSEQCHRFRRKGVPEKLRLRFLDKEKNPRAKVPYRLEIVGGRVGFVQRKKKTDRNGCVEEGIPPDASKATLYLGEGGDEEVYEFDLRHLDPIDTISGLKARLRNLGYRCGEVEGMDKQTMSALREFQKDHELDPLKDAEMKLDGDAFKPTLQKLDSNYSSD